MVFQKSDESYFQNEQPKYSVVIRMNTKDCCFLCLRTTINGNDSIRNLQSLCQFLKIDIKESSGDSNTNNGLPNCTTSSSSKISCRTLINATLCDSCGVLNDEFTNYHQILQKIQMMVDYTVDEINQKVTEAYRNPKLVQSYSQKMTSDKKSLAQLAFVDKIRKQIAQKSLTSRQSPQLKVKISKLDQNLFQREERKLKRYLRTQQAIIKEETDDFFEDADDATSDNSLPPSPKAQLTSPPPSRLLQSEDTSNSTPTKGVEFCKNEFTTRSSLTNQELMQTAKKTPRKRKCIFNKKTRKYNCGACFKDFSSKMGCWYHYQSIHEKKRYKCEICNIAIFSHPHNFKEHQLICEDTLKQRLSKQIKDKDKDPGRFKFPCKTCGRKFTSPYSVIAHEKSVHLNQSNYPCDLCERKFKCSGSLKEHKNAVHLGKKFFCWTCNKEFQFRSLEKVKVHKLSCLKKKAIRKERNNKNIQPKKVKVAGNGNNDH